MPLLMSIKRSYYCWRIKTNIEEQQQILLNAFFEGETKSAYCNAVVDAHQFVLAMIKQGKLTVENN